MGRLVRLTGPGAGSGDGEKGRVGGPSRKTKVVWTGEDWVQGHGEGRRCDGVDEAESGTSCEDGAELARHCARGLLPCNAGGPADPEALARVPLTAGEAGGHVGHP